jgi:hypothetical protein
VPVLLWRAPVSAFVTDPYDESEKGGEDMEITVVKVERIEASLKHQTEYEAA